MDIESVRIYCLSKKAVTESFPFGEDTLVFKVRGKIFLLAALNSRPLQFNIKSDPENIDALREQHDAVRPGFHMNKKHWNTIIIDGSLPVRILHQMIDESYRLVIKSLPAKNRGGL